jgi:ribonuclease VapC
MVVDSSAVIAILAGEADGQHVAACIAASHCPQMSMVSVVEVAAVSLARLRMSFADVLSFLADALITPAPIDERQMRLAGHALQTYGCGRHVAKLDFGDCFSYALAKAVDAPLLFESDDLARTDIAVALPL